MTTTELYYIGKDNTLVVLPLNAMQFFPIVKQRIYQQMFHTGMQQLTT